MNPLWLVPFIFIISFAGPTIQQTRPRRRFRLKTTTTDYEEDYELFDIFGEPRCALPVTPKTDTTVKLSDGTRFGNTLFSRQEFVKSYMDSLSPRSTFTLEFKTSSAGSGVLFYVSGANQSVSESYYESGQGIGFIALLLQDGKIVYLFDCGTGSAFITSQKTYNDSMWHKVLFMREGRDGILLVDEEIIYGSSYGLANTVKVVAPFYVGGLSEMASKEAEDKLGNIVQSFPGCIRNVEAQLEMLKPEDSNLAQNVSSCSNMVEEGTYFSNEGGYILLHDNFTVGQEMSISMDIKPRHPSGILLAIHGPKDYLILQLVQGHLVLEVENGEGPISAEMRLLTKYLCDGQWHTVEVLKNNSYVSIYLKGKGFTSTSKFGIVRELSTDTNDPLYIGGLPASSLSKKGVGAKEQFVGCMRFLKINNKLESFTRSKVFGHVTLNTCPTI